MKVTIAGTGYVGLVTGVCLAEIGHDVICIDVDEKKIEMLKHGQSPIYEPGLEEMISHNLAVGNLCFTVSPEVAYKQRDVIIIAVGTPENIDGSADMSYIHSVTLDIATYIDCDAIVSIKSTVPVGTNEKVARLINSANGADLNISVVSNPEFLREGSAIEDTFKGDRIVIGSSNQHAGDIVEALYEPFHIPVIRTDIRSSEMIKYASNAFLATKISFINEIANISEKLGANIEDVATGIGLDQRIGRQFLQAGIGYGGSCFPKDTKALVQLAGDVKHKFDLLESVINVNNNQPLLLVRKAKEMLGELKGKKIGVLGVAFKPNTDDIRESASLVLIKELLHNGAAISVYDPVALVNVEKTLGSCIKYCSTIDESITGSDMVFIGTDWEQIKNYPVHKFKKLLNSPIVFDGRNCFSLEEMEKNDIFYVSIGRKPVLREVCDF